MASNRKKKTRFRKQLIILLAMIALVYSAFYAYLDWYESGLKSCGRFFSAGSAKTPELCLEIADTEGRRAKGLMFRKPQEIEEHGGMIFIYPEEGMRSFWMKNTFTPLDMIFMDSDLTVVGIVENATPMTETPRMVEKPSRYIIELHAGSAARWNISRGDKFTTERKLPEGQS